MRFALCNEMFGERPLAEVCAIARDLGYHGLELAPYTLGPSPDEIDESTRRESRKTIEDHGLETVGLHWLFISPEGLCLTSPDPAVWRRTRDQLLRHLDLCADLGGRVLVVGSGKQRNVADGQTRDDAWDRAVAMFRSVLDRAASRRLTLCLEPLSPAVTNFINTVEDGMGMVREIDHPNFRIHLDVCAMASEPAPIADTIRAVRADDIGHVHVNDPNYYGPGMGAVDYAPIARAFDDVGWDRWLSVEVFKFDPDPETIARQSIEYLRRFWARS